MAVHGDSNLYGDGPNFYQHGATQKLLCGWEGDTGAVRRGGGVGKTGFRAGPLVLCIIWGKLLAPKAPENCFWPHGGKFVLSYPGFTPHVYVQNNQRVMGIILRYSCWGTHRCPPPTPGTPAADRPTRLPLPEFVPAERPRGEGGMGFQVTPHRKAIFIPPGPCHFAMSSAAEFCESKGGGGCPYAPCAVNAHGCLGHQWAPQRCKCKFFLISRSR